MRESLSMLDAVPCVDEQVLVAQDELGGVVGRHGDAEFGHLDRAGVLHQRRDDVGVDGDHAVDRVAAALRVQDLGGFGDVGEVGGHRQVLPHAGQHAAVGPDRQPEAAVAVEHLGRAAVAAGAGFSASTASRSERRPNSVTSMRAVVDGRSRRSCR